MTDTAQSEQNIKRRLEELHKWQEEQQRVIDQKQEYQRVKLNEEQKVLYSQLGIFPLHEDKNNNQQFEIEDIPKRKFLKRGEGLKARFKVDPDRFRLNNLPKYKYSISKPKIKEKPLQKSKKSGFNTNGYNNHIDNNVKTDNNLHIPKYESNLSNQLIYDGSPANKEFKYVNLCAKEEHVTENKTDGAENSNSDSDDPQILEKFPDNCKKNLGKDQIQANNLEFSISRYDEENDKSENISIFELIEKKTKQGSFNINASLIQKWIQEKANSLLVSSKDMDNDKNETKQNQTKNPSTLSFNKKKLDSEESTDFGSTNTDASETDTEDDCSKTESLNHIRQNNSDKNHVRFCENVEINCLNDRNKTKSPCKRRYNYGDNIENNSSFEKFKESLFKAVEENDNATTLNDTTLIQQILAIPVKNDLHREEVLEKTELLKTRLIELENEIISFRQNNSDLLRAKQEHELEKLKFEQERTEFQEKFNDEKIKYEIHLHDEKLKIEEEKKKLTKMILKPKEREEILKLKDEIDKLQTETKNKESKHIAAQARLRAQIRILEKEIKDLVFEIDNLKKENKQLQSENARMTRQNNNKMLQEINKSIAKLAVKPIEIPIETEVVKNKNIRPVVAKVISHQRNSNKGKCYKKPSDKRNKIMDEENNQNSTSNESETSCYSSSTEDEKVFRQKKNKFVDKKECRKTRNDKSNSSSISKFENSRSYNSQEYKREIENEDGSKDIWYPNGNLKKISADGMNIKMLYFNKDIKETNISEGTVRYYYAEKNTWHTTYLDGLEILEFPNGQKEHRLKDGTIEVHFPNGSIRITNPSDQHKLEEWRYADGTNCVHLRSGDKILSFPNGQKEIHTKIHKRREYPDGTVKIVYPDGSQETRYSNGRVRLKDKDGNLIMDSENNIF